MFKKAIALILSVSLILTQPVFAQGVSELNIGKYLNQMPVLNTDSFRPAHLRYISYDIKSNDFKLLLDQGDAKLSNSPNSPNSSTPKLQAATQELFNYFLIGLSLPNEKFWVNLRPDAPEQIIDPLLEKTDMGKIMLAADLELKKDTSSLTSPQNPEGKEYWDKLYKKAGELFGTENITIPTITRPWIVPGEVIIRESEDSAYIYKANLKVMLEEDYLRGAKEEGRGTIIDYSFNDPRMKELNKYSTELIKELILPKLTQEVNTSKKYAQLRQVFFSLILSRWFKDKYQGYSVGNGLEPFPTIDSGDLTNLTSKDPWSKDYYFSEYKKSFEQGEYNLKEQIITPTGQVIRSYVSGGADWTNIASSSIRSNDYKFWRVAAISGLILLSAWGLNYSSIQIKKETQKDYLALEINVDSWTKLHEYLPNYDSIKYYYDKYKDSIPGSDVSWLTPTDNDVVPWLTKIIMEEGNIFTIQFYKKPSIVDTLGLDSEVFFIKYRPSKVPLIEITGSFPDSIGSFPGNMGSGKYIKYLKGGIDNLRSVLGLPAETSSPLNAAAMTKDVHAGYIPEGKNDERFLRLLNLPIHAASPLKKNERENLRTRILEIVKKAEGILGITDLKTAIEDLLKRLQPNKDWITALDNIKAVLYLSQDTLSQDQEKEAEQLLAQLEELKSQIEEAALYNSDFYFNITKKNFPVRDIVHLINGISVQTNNYNNDIYHNAPFNKDFIISLIASYDVSSWSVFFKKLKEKVKKYFQDDFAQVKKLSPKTVEQFKSNLEDYKIHYIAMALVFYNPIQGKKTKKTIDQSLEAIKSYFKSGNEGSSPLAPQTIQAQDVELETGGIDFTRINYLARPMGSFQGLDLRLPLLSKGELEGIDINKELSSVEQMVNAKIDVSTDRLKRLLAAMSQKDAFTAQRETQLLPLLLRLCWLKEEKGTETTPDFRAVLLIADTGLFVGQGNTKCSLN